MKNISNEILNRLLSIASTKSANFKSLNILAKLKTVRIKNKELFLFDRKLQQFYRRYIKPNVHHALMTQRISNI